MELFTGIVVALVCAIVGFLLRRRRQYEQQFTHIPGPKGVPVLKNALQLDMPKLPWILTDWAKVHGPVYKVGIMGRYVVVINGYDVIHEYLAKGGKSTAGRPESFRIGFLLKKAGFNAPFPNNAWQLTRKIFHQFTKQFDSGLHAFEETIVHQSAEMIATFDRAAENALEMDPFDIINDTALKIILLVICGDQLSGDDPTFMDGLEYEALVWKIFADTSFDATLLDAFPWLIHAPLQSSKLVKRARELQSRFTVDLKRRALSHDPKDTLLGCLYQHGKGDDGAVCLEDDDVLITVANILFAGHGTSSVSFMFLLNILAHCPDIQDQLAKEMYGVSPDPAEYVGLKFREDMPYTRATILELMRYHSMVAVPGLKLTTSTTTVRGLTIPANTQFFINLWAMHHDKGFWGDPENFRPERFLDEEGHLVSANDPKRRHLLPFGEGLRSCPGDQFAKNRLFLWLTNICKNFRLIPGKENRPDTMSLEALRYNFLMYPPRVKIRFEKRTL